MEDKVDTGRIISVKMFLLQQVIFEDLSKKFDLHKT